MANKEEGMIGKRSIGGVAALIALIVAAGVAVACGGGGDEEASTAPAAPAPAQLVSTKLFVDVDVVRGPENVPTEDRPRKSCVQASRIPLGGQVVWRVRVMDPKTGLLMDDKALATVVAVLPDGQSFPLKYGPHPANPPGEYFWTSSFKVPLTYPTGVLDYKVLATDKEGRTGEFKQIMSVPSAVLTIVATDPWVMTSVDNDTFALR